MDPLIEKTKADIAEIDEQIAVLKADRQMKASWLAMYDKPRYGQQISPGVTIPPPPKTSFAQSLPPPPAPTTAKARITDKVASILSDGVARHTRQLLPILAPIGLLPGAADKVIGLANLLSRDPRFVADRTHGWTLKK